MSTQIVFAALMRGHVACVELRRSAVDDAGQITVRASSELPEPLRSVAAEHDLPTTYERSTTISADDPTAQWAVDLLVCDVVADMRRNLHPVLAGRPPWRR